MQGFTKIIVLFAAVWLSRAAHAGHGDVSADWKEEGEGPVFVAPAPFAPNSLTVTLPTNTETAKKEAATALESIKPSSLVQSVAVLLYAETRDHGTWSDDNRWRTISDRIELLSKRNVPTVKFIRLSSISISGISDAWKQVEQAIRGEKLAVSSVTLILNSPSRTQNGQTELFTDDGFLPGSRIGAMVKDLSDKRTVALHELVNPIETVLISNATGTFDCSQFPGQVAGLSQGMIRNYDGFLAWYGQFFNEKKYTSLPLKAEEWYSSLKHLSANKGNIPSICTPEAERKLTGTESASFVFPEIVPGL